MTASVFRQHELEQLQSRTSHLPDTAPSGLPVQLCLHRSVNICVHFTKTKAVASAPGSQDEGKRVL